VSDRDGRRLLAVTEEELQRVVLDIHDGPVQALFAALGQLALLRERTAAAADAPDVARIFDRIEDLLEASLRDIGSVVSTLRSPVFMLRSFVDIAEELVMQHETLFGGTVAFAADPLPTLGPLGKVALYRILQEALSNVRRHAASTSTTVRLSADGNAVLLEVEDDGRGFDPPALTGPDATERSQHIGLRGMRERAATVGGTLHVESSVGAGTRVVVRIPAADDPAAFDAR
jgi:signal transduction histidine kinase